MFAWPSYALMLGRRASEDVAEIVKAQAAHTGGIGRREVARRSADPAMHRPTRSDDHEVVEPANCSCLGSPYLEGDG